jgi:RNA polymerase sigma-54 factor
MALELRQQLKLNQTLVMTPQLQQAIKLLQLSRVELVETIQNELMENPLLEETVEEIAPDRPDLLDGPEQAENRPVDAKDASYDMEAARGADWEDYLGDFASTPRQVTREYEEAEDMTALEARHTARPTLESHLTWQLRLSPLTEKQKDIGEIVIGNLSSSGYLQATVEEVAAMAECSVKDAETVLAAVQAFDPVGVAARTPQECLLVQLRMMGYDRDPVLVSLVTEHLEDLEARRYKPLLRKFRLGMEDLREYLDIIQALDPMPGASYGGGEPTYVSPDVYVFKHDGEFVILLNEDGLPQLQISTLYDNAAGATEQEKEYFLEKQRAASWLIKSLFQRQRTLRKVVESIVRHQHDFFEEGVSKLKPLILKDIADDISMHESTVSRITTNKYAATAHGVYELKFFFNSALELDDGSQVGSESVKALIRKCVNEEDPREPLSDERIGELLKEHLAVRIARRTVAKYRMAMNIPSSSHRRAHF